MERPHGSDDARRAQRAELLAAFDSQMRGRLSMRLPDGAHDEEAGPVYRSWGWAPRGLVLYRDLRRLDGAQLDALIERQVDFFGALELAFEWKTYAHDRTDDLTGRLLAHGFVPEELENLLIGRVPEMNHEPRLPPEVTLRQVTSRADTDRMAEMLSIVWNEDRSFFGELLFNDVEANPDHVVLLVAESSGKVVSTARLNLEPNLQFATLWAGSTLPGWRGRGIYRATVAYRARLAAKRGFQYLQVDASEDSRPILERLGLLTVGSTTPYIWSPTT
jgi:GNAT superfamily N-acetyltransferase